MYKTNAHHLLTNAQTVPKQQHPPPQSTPLSFIVFPPMMPCGMEYPFGQVRSAALVLSSSSSLYP